MRIIISKNKKYPAFSFLEVVISIFIFALVILVATAIFSKVILARKSARKIQNDVDTGKIALDIMAKNMQMSSGLTSINSNTGVYFFNNSQQVCIKYQIAFGVLMSTQTTPDDINTPDCLSPTINPYPVMDLMIPTSMTVTGRFIIIPTDKTSSPKVIGRGTILLIVDGKYNLQTTVSFREYDGIIY